jgi:Lar family restriction alleviation protein
MAARSRSEGRMSETDESGCRNGLEPCPFCGSTAVLLTNELSTKLGKRYGFMCGLAACRTRGPHWHPSREEAIAAWNRRAGQDGRRYTRAQLEEMSVIQMAAAIDVAMGDPVPDRMKNPFSAAAIERRAYARKLAHAAFSVIPNFALASAAATVSEGEEQVRGIKRASPALPSQDEGWREIETAPKDGTPIKVLVESEIVWEGHHPALLMTGWHRTAERDRIVGWMPLPAPPAKAHEGIRDEE